jgi:hypothetical protein
LVQLVPAEHDDQDVHVTTLVRRAVGVRAEEDDLLGTELVHNITGEAADEAHGNVATAVPAGLRGS